MTVTQPPAYSRDDAVAVDIAASAIPAATLGMPATDGGATAGVHLRLTPVSLGQRTTANLVCVIDVSGSMGEAATIKNEQMQVEDSGLSVLDIVKHAVKTLIAVLEPGDSLAIVTFTDDADVVDTLQPLYSTNLWAGLSTGLDLLSTSKLDPATMSGLFLLTDGVRNLGPAKGDVAALEDYRTQKEGLPCVINTFGFGNSLASADLVAMARIGNGSFGFIPDASFIGTIFVNAAANLLSTAAKDCVMTLAACGGSEVVLGADGKLPGGFAARGIPQPHGTLLHMHVPNLRAGQPLDLVVPMRGIDAVARGEPFLKIKLRFRPWNSSDAVETELDATAIVSDAASAETRAARKNMQRLLFVDTMLKCMDDLRMHEPQDRVVASVEALIAQIDPELNKELLVDLRGEARLAVSGPNFGKWGRHYLPCLVGAHALQLCANFKDPGLQEYGGELFRKLRDEFDAAFVALPPPKPTRTQRARGAVAATYTSSTAFHSRSRPCFAGECGVRMADGSVRAVRDLAAGDRVATSLDGSTPAAAVVCVVLSPSDAGRTHLVALDGGLRVTPFHPVRAASDGAGASEWVFPRDLGDVREAACDAVFNFVLDHTHTMVIGGRECVTLGHGRTDNAVVAHDYFGTRRVVDDLAGMRGWARGLVVVGGTMRDPSTGLVCGLVEMKPVAAAEATIPASRL
ncbi:hypothetical protein HK105_203770 [Polyrhizophydium stewartii]|uniref:VWFA domain-containing protein n=1 Tax=Polyrhizophydium stewartii TaxID=2732419 RepID=A0ABR4MUZ7_9FUNG